MTVQLFAVYLAPDPKSPGKRVPERQAGYVFAWLHSDAKQAYTLAVHRDPAGSPDRWTLTHVHSGRSCGGGQALVMPTTSPPPAHLISEACKHMDRLSDKVGRARMDSIFRATEADPPAPYPVAIAAEADARKVPA